MCKKKKYLNFKKVLIIINIQPHWDDVSNVDDDVDWIRWSIEIVSNLNFFLSIKWLHIDDDDDDEEWKSYVQARFYSTVFLSQIPMEWVFKWIKGGVNFMSLFFFPGSYFYQGNNNKIHEKKYRMNIVTILVVVYDKHLHVQAHSNWSIYQYIIMEKY